MRPVSLLAATTRITAKPPARRRGLLTEALSGAWRLASAFPSGYRSCVAWVGTIQAWIAVGPNGSDVSRDDGRTWKRFDAGNWNAFSPPWAAGPGGRIGSLDAKSRSLALKDSTSGTGRN